LAQTIFKVLERIEAHIGVEIQLSLTVVAALNNVRAYLKERLVLLIIYLLVTALWITLVLMHILSSVECLFVRESKSFQFLINPQSIFSKEKLKRSRSPTHLPSTLITPQFLLVV
jgi:hypothetical protein